MRDKLERRPDNEQEMKSKRIWSHLEGEHLKTLSYCLDTSSCLGMGHRVDIRAGQHLFFQASIISLTRQRHFQDARRDFRFKVLS